MRIRLFFAVILAAYGVFAQEPDFRKVTWGMTQTEVIATEAGKPAEVRQSGAEVIVKYDSVKTPEAEGRLIYIFADGKLVRAKYLSDTEHSELNDFIADYRAVEPLLMEKYGKPTDERAVWDNDSLQQERLPYLDQDRAVPSQILPSDQYVGLSVSLGYLKLYTQRATTRTKIVHALAGENNHITHQIEYRSIELERLEKQVLRQDSSGAR